MSVLEGKRSPLLAVLTPEGSIDLDGSYLDRRRSPRVELPRALPCLVFGMGQASVHSIGLGGATLVSSVRPPREQSLRLRLAYGDMCADAYGFVNRIGVHELYYDQSGCSRVRYACSITFEDASVPMMNLIYRILGDHWVAEANDDTNPVDEFMPVAG